MSKRSPEIVVPACDISHITDTPSVSTDTELRVSVMRSTTFLHIDGKHISVNREAWDKIRALEPPTD